jgi:hypothetical protein
VRAGLFGRIIHGAKASVVEYGGDCRDRHQGGGDTGI